MIVVWYFERSRAIKQRKKEFAIAHNPFWKKQKRFLRQSQGKDSREPVAIRTNQTIQRARSRAKAFYAKGERTILIEISNIPKSRYPRAHQKAEIDRQAEKIKQDCQATKKIRTEASQSGHKLKTKSNSRVVAIGGIKRLKSALASENKGCIYGEKGKSRVVQLWSGATSANRVGFNPIPSNGDLPMRTTQQFSITLPNEMADIVKRKVAAGEYATESEVIRDGLRVLMARDRAVENWLNEQVGSAYDALKADPTRAVSVDQVRAMLAAEHKQFTAKA
jgi:putative addiction module CopG family antidote